MMKIYKVGGHIRDLLIGRDSSDVDYVVVGASEEEMIRQGYVKVGASFPVFLHPITKEEYAFARKERKTGPGYKGFETIINGVTLEEDLERRDLTINSIAMDDDQNFIDPFGGRDDIKKKMLRHTSEAFSEDPLRVIRLARFHAVLSFDIHPTTFSLATKMVLGRDIDQLSSERIVGELQKIANESALVKRRFFFCLESLGILRYSTFFSTFIRGDATKIKNWQGSGDFFFSKIITERTIRGVFTKKAEQLFWLRGYLMKALERMDVDHIMMFADSNRSWSSPIVKNSELIYLTEGEFSRSDLDVIANAIYCSGQIEARHIMSTNPDLKGEQLGRELHTHRRAAIFSVLSGK